MQGLSRVLHLSRLKTSSAPLLNQSVYVPGTAPQILSFSRARSGSHSLMLILCVPSPFRSARTFSSILYHSPEILLFAVLHLLTMSGSSSSVRPMSRAPIAVSAPGPPL